MELENQPIENTEEGRGYPQGRFNLLLAVLAVILLVIGVAQFTGTRAVEPSGISESVLQGDIAAKTAYFYTHGYPSLRPQAGQFTDLAFKRYRETARKTPTPEVYRRLIILSHEFDGRDTAQYIKQLERAKDGASRAVLRSEAAMWRDVYLGDAPSRSEAQTYAQRIRRLDLGWSERVALNHLYSRAGLTEQAEAQQDLARSEALRTLLLLTILMVVMLGLGLGGLGLLARYASQKRRGVGSADLPAAGSDPVVRSRVAGYMLEAFVAYMLAIIAVQLIGGSILGAAGIRLSAMGEVIVTVAAYVLSGLVALSYLAERLRRAGMTWADIGLRSRRPFADVLAGIGAYAAALPLVVLTALVAQWLSRYVESPENPIIPLFIESESWIAKVVLFLLAVVAAPFFEELFFRGVLFNSLRAKWGVVAGVIVSAAVFGMVHPLPIGLLPIFVLGAVFAVVFYERGSLLPSMVAHACNNAVAFILLFILAG